MVEKVGNDTAISKTDRIQRPALMVGFVIGYGYCDARAARFPIL